MFHFVVSNKIYNIRKVYIGTVSRDLPDVLETYDYISEYLSIQCILFRSC